MVFHARTKENKEVKDCMTREKEIEALNYITHQLKYGYIDLGSHDEDELEVVKQAIHKQTPKKPVHIHEVYPKHDWFCDEDGEIDMWAMESGFHNGPMCQRCYHSECHHCNPYWDNDECIVDENRCPSCGVKVSRHIKFCTDCGQALDWSE